MRCLTPLDIRRTARTRPWCRLLRPFGLALFRGIKLPQSLLGFADELIERFARLLVGH
jgi:hypothetical protein